MIKHHEHPKEVRKKERGPKRRTARGKATKHDEDAHARTITNHNDIPPKHSPAFSTSLSSPSLLALGKGRKIGLASNPTVARIVGLDIPGEPITGLENAKFG